MQEIKDAIHRLNSAEKWEVYEWLENVLEDQMEFTEEFKTQIETSEHEMDERRMNLGL